MRTPPTLLVALAVSAGLHALLLALGAWLPLLYGRPPPHTRPERLAAHLRAAANAAQPAATPAVADDLTAAAPGTTAPRAAAAPDTLPGSPDLPVAQADRAGQTQAPRFTKPPQFRILETYPLASRLRLSVRLYVNRTGVVERVDVLESGPVPTDMLDAIVAELYNTRLSPAHTDGESVAATLDLVIGAEEIAAHGTNGRAP